MPLQPIQIIGLMVLLDMVEPLYSMQLVPEQMFILAVGEYGIVSRTIGYGQTIDTNWSAMNLIEERFEPVTREFTLESSSYGEKGNTFNSVVYSPYLDNWYLQLVLRDLFLVLLELIPLHSEVDSLEQFKN